MKTKAFTITFIAILMATTAVSQASRPASNLQATVINYEPVPLQTGEDADISFKITNQGDSEAKEVKAEIVDRYPFKLKPDRKRVHELGNIVPGESYYISTDILVNETASDGQHKLPVRLYSQDFSKVVELPLEVQGQEIELNLANLQTTPSQLMPDTEDNKMALEVVNNGEKTAENVVLQLEYPDFFEKTSSFSTRQALGNIKPGQVKKAEFNFDLSKEAPKGETRIEVMMKYSTSDSTTEIQQQETFRVKINGKPQFKVINYTSNLKKGQKRRIEVKVRNVGEEKSTSTRIRVLDSSDQPLSYTSASQYIGTLEPGQEGSAVFEATTEQDAPAKNYLIDFEIRGKKDTEIFTKDTTLKVKVSDGVEEGRSQKWPYIIGAAALLAAIGLYYWRRRGNKSDEGE